ncbi:MAG: type III polyketide synthase [Endomicrobiales bacterium]
MKRHYGALLSGRSLKVVDKVFGHPGIRRRYFALDDPACLLSEDPDRRIARFTHWAVRLSRAAAEQALLRAGVGAGDVKALVVNTCTGYLCPGLSTYLVEELGLGRGVKAFDLVGSGCGGAIPNLQLCSGLLADKHGVVLSIAVEICSGTFQMGDDLSLIVSNALFGDGAAAAVVWDRPEGLELVDSESLFVPEYREHIRFVYRNGQLHNQLSASLPRLVGKNIARLVGSLLARNGLDAAQVKHWALHPGGERIIEEVRKEAGLAGEQVRHSRSVLSEYGNMSSATAWFVMRKILDEKPAPGDWCALVAFGAGFSAHACLLRAGQG